MSNESCLRIRRGFVLLVVALAAIAAGAVISLTPRAVAGDSPPQQVAPKEPCLTCHSNRDLSMTFPNGNKLSLYVDGTTLASSVHGNKLACSDCHSSASTFALPHGPVQVQSRREYSKAEYEVCKRCHFANYTKTLDSIHYQAMSQGNAIAPLCTDCHGAHNVTSPDVPRTKTSQTCSACHQTVYQQYSSSVHGKALVQENNTDVPLCTDCHGVHNVHDPTAASFRLDIPSLCGKCHGNREMMKKYGLSDQVLKTYLQDFHGASITLQKKNPGEQTASLEAMCTDCHGVHNITRTDDPNSPVMKANLLTTCQKCHPNATPNFSGAWLSHYEPSVDKAPLVYLVKIFYSIMIPFVIGGLTLHVLVDIWRASTGR